MTNAPSWRMMNKETIGKGGRPVFKHLRFAPKETWMMFKVQMQAIFRSAGAWVVIGGLTILPSFYAWFNIAANDDPYSLTGNLRVAVANLDEGADFRDLSIKDWRGAPFNIGDKLVAHLAKDDKFKWTFVSRKKALQGVRSGEYYAAIIIPKDFSRNIVSFTREELEEASIDFYVNEKINAIPVKITETGMNSLEDRIGEAFVQELSELVLHGLSDVEKTFLDYKPVLNRSIDTLEAMSSEMTAFVNNFGLYEESMKSLSELSKQSRETLPDLSDHLRHARDLTLTAQNTLQGSKESLTAANRLVNRQIDSLPYEVAAIHNDLERLRGVGDDAEAVAADRMAASRDEISRLIRRLRDIRHNLEDINDVLPIPIDAFERTADRLYGLENRLPEWSDALSQIEDDLRAGRTTVQDAKLSAQAASDNAIALATELHDIYDREMRPLLDEATNQTVHALDNTYVALGNMSALIPKADALLGDVMRLNSSGQDTLLRLRPLVGTTQAMVDEMSKRGRSLTDDEKYTEALDYMKKDVEKRSKFLAHPAEIYKKAIYPVPNYGSGMAPFYTVLAIWVGCILSVAVISPTNHKGLARKPDATVSEMYFSRLMLFLTVATMQATVVIAGDLWIIDVYCVHPVLFFVYGLFIAHMFTYLLFSLVFTFGNIGKAIAIIFLVLQIPAGGGTFPAEMTPAFFQAIHPFLPFTYAISCMREITAGIYRPTLVNDTLTLLLIPVLSILMVLAIGPRIRRYMVLFERNLKRSGLE